MRRVARFCLPLLACVGMTVHASPEHHCESIDDTPLRIIEEATEYEATLPSGETIVITRTMTACAKNKGWLQPLVPAPGITPVHPARRHAHNGMVLRTHDTRRHQYPVHGDRHAPR
jgi:hypothetical protein